LEVLVCLGRAKEAIAIARSIPDPSHRFDRLLLVHAAVRGAGELENLILSEAHNAARLIVQDWVRVPKLTELAETLASIGRQVGASEEVRTAFAQAETAAWQIPDMQGREGAVFELAKQMPQAARVAEAITYATQNPQT